MKKILLAVVSTLTIIFVTESILHIFPQLASSVPLTGSYDAPCFMPGTYYWFQLIPNNTCTLTSTHNAFPPVTIQSNSARLRSPELTTPKPPGTTRILFIGDSFAMGWGVDVNNAYPKQLEALWNADNPKHTVEIVNAGLVHTAQGYQYLFLKNEFDRVQPDIVVSGLYAFNDIFDSQYSSRWTLTDSRGLPEKIDSPLSYVDSNGRLRTTYNKFVAKIPILRESRIIFLLLRAFYGLPQATSQNIPEAYLRVCIYKADCHALDAGKEKVKTLFRAIHDLTRAHNVPLLVIRKPAELTVAKGVRLPKYGIPYIITPQDKEYSHKEFLDFFTSEGIPYLDLRDAFLAHQNELLYFQNDDHWNERGHQVAAEAIANKLKDMVIPTQTP